MQKRHIAILSLSLVSLLLLAGCQGAVGLGKKANVQKAPNPVDFATYRTGYTNYEGYTVWQYGSLENYRKTGWPIPETYEEQLMRVDVKENHPYCEHPSGSFVFSPSK